MSDIVNIVESDDFRSLSVGDGTKDIFEMFFSIYEKVNAKNQETSKTYNNNLMIKFSDIKELHDKNMQTIRTLRPAKGFIGVRIVVSHNEGESEKFNSFEEFSTYNITSPNAISNILMIYNFTSCNDAEQTFETYKIKNQIHSRVAHLQQIEKEAPPFMPKAILANIVTPTAHISVEYTDYVKARTFTAMFDEWIKGCDETKHSDWVRTCKKFSYLIPRFGRFLIYAIIAYSTIKAIDYKVILPQFYVSFLIAYSAIFMIISGVCESLFKKMESAIDSYLPLAYLDINKGDKKLISEYANRNKKSIILVIAGFLGTIALSVSSRFIYDLIKWLIVS